MILRILVASLLLFVPLWAAPTEAIVAACPNGFQNCDPFTGACYTAWAAQRAGVSQSNCAANPAACFQQSLTEPACSAPAPPPVNPNALRICPWGVDCGVGYPPHPIDAYLPDVRADAPFAQGVIYHYVGHPSITGPLLPPSLDVNLALDCILYHSAISPLGDGLPCAPPANNRSSRIVRPPTVVFEPAPSCGWTIAPTSPVQPCVLPQAALLAAMKVSETQWTGVANYYRYIRARYVRLMRALTAGKHGAFPEARYAVAQKRFLWYGDLLALMAPLLLDPPNASYQFLPQPSTTYPPVTLPAADATLTAAQIAQHATWLTALREVNIVTKQLVETMDNLAGALVADAAGTLYADLWVAVLSQHWDTVAATVSQKGALEVAARSGITGPVVQEDAACATPTDAVNALKSVVQNGSTLYGGHLVYSDLLEGPCAPAATFPALLTDDGGADAAAYAGMATLGMAAYLCGANADYCDGAMSVTLVHPAGGESYPTGSVQTIQWTSANLPGSVRFHLIPAGGQATLLNGHVANTGSKGWTITLAPGQYRMRITANPPELGITHKGALFTVTP